MVEDIPPFERLTRGLATLSQADLLALLNAVNDLEQRYLADPTYQGRVFQAEGMVLAEPSEPALTLQDMLQLIAGLNPAQLKVLGSLIPTYFEGISPHRGQRVSASWGTTHPAVSFATNVNWSRPNNVPDEELLQRMEGFQAFVALVKSAHEAKAAGDYQKSADLFDQATNFLKDHGVSGTMLAYFLGLFKS